MIIDISDSTFRRLFQNQCLHLPIRWNGDDFYAYLEKLFDKYCNYIENEHINLYNEKFNLYGSELLIKQICNLIKQSVKNYLNGYPAKAYSSFAELMDILQMNPLKVYNKSCFEMLGGFDDKLNLFRVANVDDNKPYNRTRVFHTPYNLRSKVSASRYSIAGYPSLYLGTSLELCCEEVKYNPHKGFAIASKFKIERNIENNDTIISVIELALKPQDFLGQNTNINRRRFYEINLEKKEVKTAYLLWYPLIAACSFIRTNKNYPFAAEYIVPQLLMQWVRCEMQDEKQLIGIRYFSCASVRSSDMGFNYVFPVSGKKISTELPYCPILSRAFRLTLPHFINESVDIESCEESLINDNDMDFI